MRPELSDPTFGHAHLARAIAAAEEIYELVELGKDCSAIRRQLGLLAKRPVGTPEVLGAFGSISPVTFAKNLLVDWNDLPTDLTESEMLELLTRITQVSGEEFQVQYWVECLRTATGDENISDLIYWPGEYFKDGDNSRELDPPEILATALRAGSRSRGT